MIKRPMLQEIITNSEEETILFAKRFADNLPANRIIFLEGPLGAGKSVFARALIRALCKDDSLNVPSPTFTLLQTYENANTPIWHYDLYRLKDPDEMEELSWDDALSGGVVLIEWPERLGYLKPQGLMVTLEPLSPSSRKITVSE